jgi:hypothetical protein
MIKKVLFSLCLIIITSLQVSAQKSSVKNTLSVKIDGGKSTVRAGQQVILKAIGFNEETAYLQWQVSTDGVAWQDIAKANGSNFETAPITESQFIRVVSRPNEGYLAIDDVSNAQIITLSENVASSKKKKQ